MEFVALPLCPPALNRSRCPADVCTPVPCPVAPLWPDYATILPSAAVRRNSREVPISPLLPWHPLVTGLLAPKCDESMYQFDTRSRLRRPCCARDSLVLLLIGPQRIRITPQNPHRAQPASHDSRCPKSSVWVPDRASRCTASSTTDKFRRVRQELGLGAHMRLSSIPRNMCVVAPAARSPRRAARVVGSRIGPAIPEAGRSKPVRRMKFVSNNALTKR
jgi:hypothetical protein